MQGSSVPLGRNHVSPSGAPHRWALRIVLTSPPPYGAPAHDPVYPAEKTTTTETTNGLMVSATNAITNIKNHHLLKNGFL